MRRRVVITGLGAVTPIGTGKEKFWEGLISGKNGIGPVTHFDAAAHDCKIAAEVKDFNPEEHINKKDARRMDRFTQFAVAASILAHKDSGLDLEKEDRTRIGVLIGSGIGGIGTLEEACRTLIDKGPSRLSPFTVPMMIANMAAGQAAITLGLKGPNTCVVTACATGSHAIGDATEVIRRDEADLMFAGGAEAAITRLAMASFDAAKTMSTRNDDPAHACRPFDKDRNGFVMGEGAGVVVLEELNHALSRGATIYAEVVGYGLTGDAYHITAPAPGGEGAVRSMQMALKDAGLAPEAIDYINAHGTSTELNDKTETAAVKAVFGQHAYKLAMSSTKSMTGHLLGAAGGIEAIATALAIKEDLMPPTINYQNPDPECDLDCVPNTARKREVNAAMSNSLGFGGHNATLILKKFRG